LKKILFIFLFLALTKNLFPNAAAPGFYNTGGSAEFTPFFATDSAYLDKIQMQSELITVLLYPDFAVIRGEYNMLNLSDKEITFNTGYPINGLFDNDLVYNVSFDDIYNLKIFTDGIEIPNEKLKGSDSTFLYDEKKRNLYNNWYVWKSVFKPNAITNLKVYFIVNTSNSILRKGYSKDKDNGFVYILESGRAWAKNIESGRINIQLMDGLKPEDIIGISPQNKFKINEDGTSLIYDFKNLEPEPADNVLIRYKKPDDSFDFNSVTSNSQKYFDEIDKIHPAGIFAGAYKNFTANDFKVRGSFWDNTIGYIFIFGIIGVPIILGIIVVGLTIWVVLYYRKKKKQSVKS